MTVRIIDRFSCIDWPLSFIALAVVLWTMLVVLTVYWIMHLRGHRD